MTYRSLSLDPVSIHTITIPRVSITEQQTCTTKLQQIFCCQIYLQLKWTALAKSSSCLQQMIVDKIYKTIAPHQPTKIQVMWMVSLTHFLYSRKAEAAEGRPVWQQWNKIMFLTTGCLIMIYKISASADRGPRSRVCARETLRWPPINTSGNFPAHVSAESPSNISPNPSEVISEVSEPSDKNPKNAPRGPGGVSKFF